MKRRKVLVSWRRDAASTPSESDGNKVPYCSQHVKIFLILCKNYRVQAMPIFCTNPLHYQVNLCNSIKGCLCLSRSCCCRWIFKFVCACLHASISILMCICVSYLHRCIYCFCSEARNRSFSSSNRPAPDPERSRRIQQK